MRICFFAIAVVIAFPVQAGIKDDEEVVFFRSYAYAGKNRTVVIPVHGWIYEPEMKSRSRALFVSALEKMIGAEHLREGKGIFESRLRLFLADNEREKKIDVKIGKIIYRAGVSRPNGHFSSTLTIDYDGLRHLLDAHGRFQITLASDRTGRSQSAGTVRIIPANGLAVISDIDDTIKITNVTNRKEMIRNTFLRPYLAVPGMARVYERWEKRNVVFHYVSGSPWHLYLPLSEFMARSGFPEGCLYLKEFRLKDATGIKFIVGDNVNYKISVIEGIIKTAPEMRYILVGDSGERDPEVYSKIWKKYPEKVHAVYIREIGSQIQRARYDSLFNASPVFHVFSDAGEIK